MKKRFPTLPATLVWAALFGQQATAVPVKQCLHDVPAYDNLLIVGDQTRLPVRIDAKKTEGHYPDSVLFNGGVIVEQGNSVLTADRVVLNQIQKSDQAIPSRTVTASGSVKYADPHIVLQGPTGWSDLNTKDIDLLQGSYQMVGRQGRGDADKIRLRAENRYAILENGTFTSCLPGDDSWSLAGSKVIHSREEQIAEIWHARFQLGKIPVFYSPYIQFATGNRRHSGFLIPNAQYDAVNGFEFILPWYWNIAPDYDATITSHWIERRGLQWQNEFRYLAAAPGSGTMAFDWLPSDKKYASIHADNSTRWLFFWGHSGVMDKVWRFSSDFTRVSDPHYFTDLASAYGSSTDGYTTQKFSLGYAEKNWNATLVSKQFQVFNVDYTRSVYRAEPELVLNFYQNDLGPFDTHIFAQAAQFTNVNPHYPKASRWHIEPSINLPIASEWASLNTSVKLLATHYQQNIPSSMAGGAALKGSVNRVMPEFKTDGKVVFDRDVAWIKNYTQTLEPRVQYLYVPYRDQDNIYLYDSTRLQNDYYGLFRDRSYSGFDRIASASRITTGLTSRLYDDILVERFNLSVGQIYYCTSERTGNSGAVDTSNSSGSLVWAGDSYWKINEFFGVRGGLQYDPRLASVTLVNGVVEYRGDAERMLQLNYRYANSEYIQATLNENYSIGAKIPDYQQGISQVGVTGGWPVSGKWAVAGAYYYDLKTRQPASQLAGLQYSTCCWAMNLGYERKIIGWNAVDNRSKYDGRVLFNIELRGLSSGHGNSVFSMLSSGILPYQRAFK